MEQEIDAHVVQNTPQMLKSNPYLLLRRLLLDNVPKHIKLYIVTIICALTNAGATAAFAYTTRSLVNDVFIAMNFAAVFIVIGLIGGLSLIRAIATYFHAVFSTNIKRKILSELQIKQFKKLIAMETKYFSHQQFTFQYRNLEKDFQ